MYKIHAIALETVPIRTRSNDKNVMISGGGRNAISAWEAWNLWNSSKADMSDLTLQSVTLLDKRLSNQAGIRTVVRKLAATDRSWLESAQISDFGE
ncbi:MAG: hypothetical protein J5X22_13290 [Candidatus Accumulibacter sp.]|uniref:Uncharacterized protein n=1 Tax=Candidatus Accumulibacter cognatus TaxID=2954383 RepID=A0A7D5SC08_9PROT|nr:MULTISPECIES: hypothetical protein [Candidatus Accumulibacter]MBL8401069.1 hypothetical protein [Accumulibacter sp.]MBN8519762.1 hypothetical protein [Accumulibacter sp.]MBO3711445.1 hypothetical protein [Accumulibacter sp.]QLH48882.1 MAG: hypothetical protein HWD57_03085 [Candidatus Accumulibacter cognatus]